MLLKVNSDGQFYFEFKSDDSDIKEATELRFKSDRGLKDEVIEELYKDHEGDFTDEQIANINAKLIRNNTRRYFLLFSRVIRIV